MSSAVNQNEQQIFSQEQDVQCTELKQKILIRPNQIHLLINDRQKFITAIVNILNQAKIKIDINEKQQLKFALVYLKEAERVVEYAASCGKNINKELIIHILHNQASIYQKLWELMNCSNYLEGIIYNYEQFIRETSNLHSVIEKQGEVVVASADPNKFKMKQKLSRYNLQFCAINSQIANHDTALMSIKKAHTLINDSIKGTIQEFKRQISSQFDEDQQRTNLRLALLLGLSNYQKKFQDKFDVNEINKNLLKSTHFSLQIWQESKKMPSTKYKDNRQYIEYLNNYSIGNIVQITAMKFDQIQIGIVSVMKQKINLMTIDKQFHVHNKIILLSTCMFSKATELRLKSFEMYKKSPEERKTSKEYKLSINYHLLSIMMIALYIPYNLKYMNQILLSFQKHYNSNLTEYKTVQQESITKIIELLNIQIAEYEKIIDPERHAEVKSINTKESNDSEPKNDYNLKSNFQVDKIKKIQKLKRLKKITNDLTSSNKNVIDSRFKILSNKSKEYKTSLSINKMDKKERNVSKNQTLKKSPSFYQDKYKDSKEKHFYQNSKDKMNIKTHGEQKKAVYEMAKSRNKDVKKSKSKSKHIIDQTQELFFCFTKKTKKTQGLASPGYLRGSSNRSSSIKSKDSIKKSNLNTPRNMKINTMKSPKNIKEPPKRRNVGQTYYNF